MPRINPEGQLTRAERLATVIAIAGAVLVHLVVLLGWGRLSRWTQEEEKKERLMVIRRVRDVAPPRENLPEPLRPRTAPAGPEGAEGKAAGGEKPPAPEPKVKEPGAEPPAESELSPAMEEDLKRQEEPQDEARGQVQGDASVSVVTDLPSASFIIEGPAQFRGSGTFWVRKGAALGTYRITFNPVAGFSTPAGQTKELGAKGQVVFVGKYRRSVEVVIDSNESGARLTIYRPDGRPIDLDRPGRALLEDLPPGTYTAVFKEIPGHIAPSPISRSLSAGGKLSFYGEYKDDPSVDAAAGAGSRAVGGPGGYGAGTGTGYRGSGSGAGGSGTGSGGKVAKAVPAPPADAGLDRRVQLVVTSYPPTRIERNYDMISYPEVLIRKSNFQQGWCQVYLIVKVSSRGDVEAIDIERPRKDARAPYEALIRAVEDAVRSWDYDKVVAEVHVDARFYVE